MDFEFNEQRNIIRPITCFAVELTIVIAIAVFLVYGFGKGVINTGQSMEPTIESGDTILIDRFAYHFDDPERYDLIVFSTEIDEADENGEPVRQSFIRRIIGLPGERVKIDGGHIFINGEQLRDDSGWNNVQLAGNAENEIILDDDEYFVLGDNRQSSEDSRFDKIGNVSYDEIIGKAWFRSAPVTKIGRLK